LLSCLAIVAGLLERPTSTKALRSSLPMVGDRFTPELFVRAAARIGISARLMKRKADEIARINLPCVLLLKQEGACVLTALDGDQAEVILPETGLGATRLPLGDLRELHVGLVLFAKAEYRFDDRTQDFARPPQKAWFWGTLARFWPVYAHVVAFAVNVVPSTTVSIGVAAVTRGHQRQIDLLVRRRCFNHHGHLLGGS
jgi:ATP-binding cassette subfamily C protein LapB